MISNGIKATIATSIILAMALATGNPLLEQLFFVLMGTLVISFVWSRMNLLGVQVRRETRTHRTQVGDTAEELFAVRNTSPLPKIWLEVGDQSTLPGHQASQAFSMAGRAVRSFTVKTVCRRRGLYWLGPLSLASGDPLGLFSTRRVVGGSHPLVVYPATVALPGFEIPTGDLPGGAAVKHRAYFVTPSVSGVRQYSPGDSLNRIHWLSTARTRQLMTKEFELDPAADVWIFLDMEGRVQVGSGDESTAEYGISIAASLARHFLAQHRALGMVAYGSSHELIQIDRGTRQMIKILECLAVMQAEGQVPLGEVVAAESARFGRNTTLIVVTPSLDETWVEALGYTKHRGVRTAAVVLEANTFAAGESSALLFGALAAADITSFLVKKGDTLDQVLSGRLNSGPRRRNG